MIRSSLARLSIEQRLPLLISTLLTLVIGGFTWAAYTEVRRTALAAGRERLGWRRSAGWRVAWPMTSTTF
ncbi:MAG: hypothetical protein ACREL9_09955 [Gemmatimonadales bacterium]